MAAERNQFRPRLEALEERWQPTVTLLHNPVATFGTPIVQHANSLPPFIFNPVDTNVGGISITIPQHTQTTNPGFVFNPFSVSVSGISTNSQGHSGFVFNPFL